MQITSACPGHIGTTSGRVSLPQPPRKDLAPRVESPPSVARIDFSRITPRQLQEYCDELIFNGGDAEFEDATALFTSLPSGIFESDPDKPLDLTSHVEGMVEFDRTHGYDVLATFYAGLLERMKLMEARSVHLSVVA